jgi:hypothetical protein
MRWLLLLAVLPAAAADSGDLIQRARRRTRENLLRLPNYTCRMTIDRAARLASNKKWQALDTLRLDVALVGGRELFGWPGKQFEDKPITEIVPSGGMIGTGDFALHARSILIDGHAALACKTDPVSIHCTYSVPLARSAYSIKAGRAEDLVAYHGEVVFDAATLDLRRLSVEVDEPPPSLELRHARTSLEYASVDIGGSFFVLPRSSELMMIDEMGRESRNHIRFDSCRQYSGESTISFGDPGEAPEKLEIQALTLPPGLNVECALSTPLSNDKAIGDPVKAVVMRAVRKSGKTLLPKGAEIIGRLTRLQRVRRDRGLEYWVVGVHLDAVECPNAKGLFAAELQQVGISASQYHVPYVREPGPALNIWNAVRDHPVPHPGESIFYVRGSTLRTATLRMIWRTK